MELKVGDKVQTCLGKGEILFINKKKDGIEDYKYLVGIKGINGHNGTPFNSCLDLEKQKEYEYQCWWFNKTDLKKINLIHDKREEKIAFIKDWDSMVKLYGIDEDGNIHIKKGILFLKNMKNLCGKKVYINKEYKVSPFYDCDCMLDFDWVFSKEMFKSVYQEEKNLINLLKQLNINFIARDSNKALYGFNKISNFKRKYWVDSKHKRYFINEELFSDIIKTREAYRVEELEDILNEMY